MPEKVEYVKVSVRVPRRLYEVMLAVMRERGYDNVSEFVREAIRRFVGKGCDEEDSGE